MRANTRLFSLFAATCIALASSASAQFVSVSTLPGWTGSNFALSAGDTFGETFTDILAVQSVTYRFVASSTSTIPATTINAAFVEWNGSSATNTLASFNSQVIPASDQAGWGSVVAGGQTFRTYDFTFLVDLDTLSASSTYALIFSPTASTGLAFGLNNPSGSTFADGVAIAFGTQYNAQDWAFQNVVYVPSGNFVPVPETSTVAVIFSGLLVAGLAAFRLRQRRQLEIAATAVAA